MNDAQATELDIAPDFRERISQIELKLAKLNRAVFEDSKTGWEDYTVAGDGYKGALWHRLDTLTENCKDLYDFKCRVSNLERSIDSLREQDRRFDKRIKSIERALSEHIAEAAMEGRGDALDKPNNVVDKLNIDELHACGDEWTRKRILEEVWMIKDFAGDYVSQMRLGSTLPHYIKKKVQAIENLLEKPKNTVDEKDERIRDLEQDLSYTKSKLYECRLHRNGYMTERDEYSERLRAAEQVIFNATGKRPNILIDEIMEKMNER